MWGVQDLKQKWVHSDPLGGTSHSAAMSSRVDGCLKPGGTIRSWEDQFLTGYMCQGWTSFASGVVIIASDAKRLGRPPEDTNSYYAWGDTNKVSMWMLPMVHETSDLKPKKPKHPKMHQNTKPPCTQQQLRNLPRAGSRTVTQAFKSITRMC